MDDAADIINAAAKRKATGIAPTPGLNVRQPQRHRDPHREITILEFTIPPCESHPQGKTYYIHPAQLKAHQRLYPRGYVSKEHRRRGRRPARSSGIEARGHRDPKEFLEGRDVHRG